jgi:hypothetical protein
LLCFRRTEPARKNEEKTAAELHKGQQPPNSAEIGQNSVWEIADMLNGSPKLGIWGRSSAAELFLSLRCVVAKVKSRCRIAENSLMRLEK